jgi:hypothetical protein
MYRITQLNLSNRRVFHTNDLAVLWEIKDRHHLYMTISRYLDRGTLFHVFKGLYATVPVSDLDPLELGTAIIHRYTYLSTETILAQAGIISQAVYDLTFISDLSKRVQVGKWSFRYRQLKDSFLFNPIGINKHPYGFMATLERAVADLLYYNPRYHFDIPDLIDFDLVRSIQKEVGYGNG